MGSQDFKNQDFKNTDLSFLHLEPLNKINRPFLNILIQGDPKALENWLLLDKQNQDKNNQAINSYIVDGKTALSTAIMFAVNSTHSRERNIRIHCVKILLNHGADSSKLNQDGSSCFDLILKALNKQVYHTNQPDTRLDNLATQQVAYLLECLNHKNKKHRSSPRVLNTPKLCDVKIMKNLSQSELKKAVRVGVKKY